MDTQASAALRRAEPPEPAGTTAEQQVQAAPLASQADTGQNTQPANPQRSALAPGRFQIWFRSQGSRYLVRTGALILALLAWHLVSVNKVNFFINFEHIPAPMVVGSVLMSELAGQEFYLHILHSMERIAIAYGLAVVLGISLGIMVGRSRWAEDIILPYIELLRPIPAVAWIPLAILMMPGEQASIVFITFLGALFPVVLNTVHGVEQTNSLLIRAARSLGASKRAILWHVILPGAMPSIVAGLAIGMGVAWFSLLAGEIISGQYGIGYYTWTSYTLVQYPQIIIGMLTIGALGTLCTLLVRKACSPLLKWQAKGGRS